MCFFISIQFFVYGYLIYIFNVIYFFADLKKILDQASINRVYNGLWNWPPPRVYAVEFKPFLAELIMRPFILKPQRLNNKWKQKHNLVITISLIFNLVYLYNSICVSDFKYEIIKKKNIFENKLWKWHVLKNDRIEKMTTFLLSLSEKNNILNTSPQLCLKTTYSVLISN